MLIQVYSAADIAAWFGAIIAFIVLIWDIVKWSQEGPKVIMKVSPNMKIFDSSGDNNHIYVSIVNMGTTPTTIENISIQLFRKFVPRMFGKMKKGAIINFDNCLPLPYVLKPGELWTGTFLQDKLLEKLPDKSCLYLSLKHAFSEKYIYKKIFK